MAGLAALSKYYGDGGDDSDEGEHETTPSGTDEGISSSSMDFAGPSGVNTSSSLVKPVDLAPAVIGKVSYRFFGFGFEFVNWKSGNEHSCKNF